jgi:hypothetical protein
MVNKCIPSLFPAKVHRKSDQTRVCGQTQGGQCDDRIATGTELPAMETILPNLGEELAIPLVTTEETDQEDAGGVDREQGPDAVELGGEDFQDDEREGELRQGRPDVGAFKGSLGGTHLDNLVRRQDG